MPRVPRVVTITSTASHLASMPSPNAAPQTAPSGKLAAAMPV